MGLYKNGVKHTLTEEQITELKKKYPVRKRPVHLTYASHLIREDRDNPGRKTKPRSINIHCVVNIQGERGLEEWRYSERPPVLKDNQPVFNNDSIDFTGDMVVSNDIELLYFMYYLHPMVSNGEGNKNNRSGEFYYTISDPEVESASINDTMRKRMRIEMSILSTEPGIGLPFEKIKEIAKSFGLHGVDELHPEVLRRKLLEHVKIVHEGYAKFDNMQKDTMKDIIAMKVVCQECLDHGVITYANLWFSMTGKDGKPGEKLCKRKAALSDFESLYEHVSKTPDLYSDLQTRLEEAKEEKVKKAEAALAAESKK